MSLVYHLSKVMPFTPANPLFWIPVVLTTLLLPALLAYGPRAPILSIDFLASTLFPPLWWLWLISCISLWFSGPSLSSLAVCLVAAAYTLLYALLALNKRLGYGGAKQVRWSHEVAVITGGAGGLGWELANQLAEKSVKVAVWDLKAPEGEGWDKKWDGRVRWYKCDVGSEDQVKRCRQMVVDQLGPPTILINNAAIMHGSSLLSLSTPQIEASLRVNLLSHFHTVRAFLPSMLRQTNGGTIVTISSVLGHLGAANLTDYTASKAALLAFHTSLKAEITAIANHKDAPSGAKDVKTVLVKPGQLSTAMFGAMKTPSEFFGPVVNAKMLADEIVKAIGTGRDAVVAMPLYAWCIEWMGVLPVSLQRAARWFSGVDRAMEGFDERKMSE